MSLQSTNNLSTAKAYATRGWAVFPLVFRGKTPATANGFKDAVTDHAQIDALWAGQAQAGIGIATGASDLLVVDIDTKDGKQGQESWDALCEQYGYDDDTLTITTWSGGKHLYFLMPENRPGSSQGRIGKGLDVRAEGGYVVAPPTRVREGDKFGEYVVDEDWPILECPEWLATLAAKPEPVKREVTGPVAAGPEVEARVRALSNDIAMIPYGEPGEGPLNAAAFMAGQYVGAQQISEDDAIRIMLDGISGWTYARPGDEQKMIDKVIRGVRDGQGTPRAWETNTAPETDAVEPEEDALKDVTDWSTNLGQAQHLRKFLDTRLIHADGVGWFAWNGKVWNPVSEGFVLNLMGAFYRKQFRAMLDKYKATEDDKFYQLAKQYKKFMSTAQQNSILNAMKTAEGIFTEADRLDADKELLNTPGGVVNLRTGQVGPHDPRLYMTRITSGSYKPGTKMHPDWAKALSGLPEATADYLQVRLGQAITGYTPEDAVFMVGHGKNSKSLLLTDGTVRAVGGYAAMSGPALISSGQDASAATPDKAGLRGVRLAYIEEMPEARTLSVAELKRVVETSTIKARFLNANPFEFDATHSLFVTSNHDPAVNQTDDGTWRRLCMVRFPIKFVDKPEAPHERKADPMLKRRVREGKEGQHDAILTWMIEGAMRYFGNESLIGEEQRPLEVRESTREWRMKADRIMAFYAERLIVDRDAPGIARNDLYAEFLAYLAEQGHSNWSQETFGERFLGHELTVKGGVTQFRPVGAKRDALSRPPLPQGVAWSTSQKELPKQPKAYTNLRFRTDADAM